MVRFGSLVAMLAPFILIALIPIVWVAIGYFAGVSWSDIKIMAGLSVMGGLVALCAYFAWLGKRPFTGPAMTVAVLLSLVIPLIYLLYQVNWRGTVGPAAGPPGKKSSLPAMPPVDYAAVAQNVRRSVSDNGNFEKLSLSQKVPLPRPTAFVYVPPGQRLSVKWEMSGWQLTEGNQVYMAPTATALLGTEYDVNYYQVFDANLRGGTSALKGSYARPSALVRASPTVDIVVQPDSKTIVIATASKLQPVATGLIWGKLPERSLNWKCYVHLTDAQGKPVENRDAVQARKANPDGTLGPKVDFSWATYAPAEDETTLELSSTSVPAEFDHLVVPVQATTKAYVALVLSK